MLPHPRNLVFALWPADRDDRDEISAHSDKEDCLKPGAPIASVTLGDPRTFRLTDAADKGEWNKTKGKREVATEVAKFELGDRCLFVMGGARFQKQLRHEITEVTAAQRASRPPAEYRHRRINLTFRTHERIDSSRSAK
jgi:alkylated DNA repair dioxygenase AlkB